MCVLFNFFANLYAMLLIKNCLCITYEWEYTDELQVQSTQTYIIIIMNLWKFVNIGSEMHRLFE